MLRLLSTYQGGRGKPAATDNRTHGLRRSNADKRQAVIQVHGVLLRRFQRTGEEWSYVEIGDLAGVSDHTAKANLASCEVDTETGRDQRSKAVSNTLAEAKRVDTKTAIANLGTSKVDTLIGRDQEAEAHLSTLQVDLRGAWRPGGRK